MNNRTRLIGVVAMMIGFSAAWAQGNEHAGHAVHDAAMEAMDHDETPSTPRDPHAYAGGYDFSQFPMRHESAALRVGLLRFDRLEWVRNDDDTAIVYDLQAWYGGDHDRAVVKAEGDIDDGTLEDARTELFWSRAIAAFWDAQIGLRHDGGKDPSRTWLAAGVQGLAPYWFDLDVTAYVGEQRRTALSLEAEYELLVTQKLIFQPRFEANLYGKRDEQRGLGSGLADISAGLRLRYEFRREFAPYVGIEWAGKYGGTADFARAAGLDTRETRAVAGIRFWF
jgi:copper resistance protein B